MKREEPAKTVQNFEFKPDFEIAFKRTEAWWHGEIVDRALTHITFPKPPSERVTGPTPIEHVTYRDRWLDTDYMVARATAHVANTVWYGDTIPSVIPNLGPEVFSAFYGCELEFGETTSWSKPLLHDWSDASVAALQLDTTNFYYQKILEITDALIAAGRGRFNVGYTDLHGGADALAAFRDPQALCLDMLEVPEQVKALNERVTDDFLRVFDIYHQKLLDAGMLSAGWMGLTGKGRVHIPSNDFSCMISDDLFREAFIPGLERECQYMDRNIYHLDGPQALRFLDLIMDIPNLHAIQWVPGAGQEDWHDWIDVYRRIQARRKGFVAYVSVRDLDEFMGLFRPEGVWLYVNGIDNREQADAALRTIARWGRKGP